jgi:large subunit ribosomal protein L4
MKVEVLLKDGSKSGETVTLAPEIFEIVPNDHAIYMAVRSFMANQRQGTHETKDRSDVRGGGKKPFAQKKTGRARQGTSRSPLMVGGGSIFGPHPHDYRVKLPTKVKQLARKSALSYKAKESNILVVEDFTLDAPKTKEMLGVLAGLQVLSKKVLFLLSKKDANILKSGRNIPKLKILEAAKASAYEIADSSVLVLQKSSVDVLHKTFSLS